ncbi:DUF3196 family protein [Spiroplasma cantharicola]|uniref:Uncharacterized protein n=1 Tax=Spiroplasma cantharicola TaxID=362837 RepID=A0A0M4KE64_9MOLU|nr:DUF3196 family protein [Spiroplasma cantharicola]ALD66207.1 hypothetical protein SCANT_v1c02970 [Spiroplasma cantharicola]
MKNYYEDIMQKINEIMSKNDYDEAFKIVCEELSAPYVPQDFEKQLEQMQKIIMEKIKFEEKNFTNWNTEKVANIMAKKLDQDSHLMAFDALRGLNARLILEDIKAYLLDSEIKPEYKTFLIMVLIEQLVDQEILIEKNGSKISINPAKYNLREAQDILKDIELKIEQTIYDSNPSLFTICQHIANTYFYNVFPILNFDKFTLNDLAMAIIMKACDSLGIVLEESLELKIDFNKENTMILLSELNNII